MAAFDANHGKVCLGERTDELQCPFGRTRYFETQLDSLANGCVTSSKDLACVWHPGSCGTEAT